MSYPLYHTLNKKLKKSDLTAEQKKTLLKKLTDVEKEDTMVAIVMLIMEHSKEADDMQIDPEKFVLPYGVKQAGKDINIDLENLPIPLRWILWKFMNIKMPK